MPRADKALAITPESLFWVYTDSAQMARDLVVSWVADDEIGTFELPLPVFATMFNVDEAETPLVVQVDGHTVSVSVPTAPVGLYQVEITVGDEKRLLATANVQVRQPLPDLPPPPWQHFTVTGPAWYPGWSSEAGGGGEGGGPMSLDDLTDVDLASSPPQGFGEVLRYNAGSGMWEAIVPPPGYLDSLSDVDTSTTLPVQGNTLVYDEATMTWLPSAVLSGLRAEVDALKAEVAELKRRNR